MCIEIRASKIGCLNLIFPALENISIRVKSQKSKTQSLFKLIFFLLQSLTWIEIKFAMKIYQLQYHLVSFQKRDTVRWLYCPQFHTPHANIWIRHERIINCVHIVRTIQLGFWNFVVDEKTTWIMVNISVMRCNKSSGNWICMYMYVDTIAFITKCVCVERCRGINTSTTKTSCVSWHEFAHIFRLLLLYTKPYLSLTDGLKTFTHSDIVRTTYKVIATFWSTHTFKQIYWCVECAMLAHLCSIYWS